MTVYANFQSPCSKCMPTNRESESTRAFAVNLAAHLLDVAIVGLVADEFETQSVTQPLPYPWSAAGKTG